MKPKSKGAHGLRIDHLNIRHHLGAAFDSLDAAERRARELGATDQLALAIKALRTIANSASSDARSKSLAIAALRKMEVTP